MQYLIDLQPIRSIEQLNDMKWPLKRLCSDCDYILFLIGINTGLRVSDLLKMETIEMLKLKRKKRKEFKVKEGKTKKKRIINITSIFVDINYFVSFIKRLYCKTLLSLYKCILNINLLPSFFKWAYASISKIVINT